MESTTLFTLMNREVKTNRARTFLKCTGECSFFAYAYSLSVLLSALATCIHLFEKQSSSQSLKNECGKNHLTTICLGLTNAAPVNSKQWLLLACLQCKCLSSQSSQFLDAIAFPSSYPVSRWISDPLIFQTWKAPWALESAAV